MLSIKILQALSMLSVITFSIILFLDKSNILNLNYFIFLISLFGLMTFSFIFSCCLCANVILEG